jgi:hypothetical protein
MWQSAGLDYMYDVRAGDAEKVGGAADVKSQKPKSDFSCHATAMSHSHGPCHTANATSQPRGLAAATAAHRRPPVLEKILGPRLDEAPTLTLTLILHSALHVYTMIMLYCYTRGVLHINEGGARENGGAALNLWGSSLSLRGCSIAIHENRARENGGAALVHPAPARGTTSGLRAAPRRSTARPAPAAALPAPELAVFW